MVFAGMRVGGDLQLAFEKFLRLWPAEPEAHLFGSRALGYRDVGGRRLHAGAARGRLHHRLERRRGDARRRASAGW